MTDSSRMQCSVDGPIFISHRQSDGQQLANRLAWALRSFGIPVWLDRDDLPPGDTQLRLQEALESGLSGGILIATPELANSKVVREQELSALLKLADDPNFVFVVANAIKTDAGELDYAAPDRVARTGSARLKGQKQYAVGSVADDAEIAREIARSRVRATDLVDDLLPVQVLTRTDPSAGLATPGLVLNYPRPGPGSRTLPGEAWRLAREFLARLPDLTREAGASGIVLRGECHLSLGFAIGCALPEPSGFTVTVETKPRCENDARGPAAPEVVCSSEPGSHSAARCAVFVDIASTKPDDAFETHVAQNSDRYATVLRVTTEPRTYVPAEACGFLAKEIADAIRDAATTRELDLFLHTPLHIAVLLGRWFNTYRIHLYEWEGGTSPADYHASATVASGVGDGPIVSVDIDPI